MQEREKKQLGLSSECRFLQGVGPVRAERLKKLGIVTVDDLITHFPRKYYDRRNFTGIADLKQGEEASVAGQVMSIARRSPRARRSIIVAAVGDDTGIVQVVWFNQDYLFKQIKPGNGIVMSGELTYFRGERQIVNPEFELVEEDLDRELLHAGRIVPVYRLTAGVSQRFLRGLIARTLERVGDVVFENLPESVRKNMKLPPRIEAIRTIHFPDGGGNYSRALRRLKFEELFYLQLVFSLVKRTSRHPRYKKLEIDFSLERRYLEGLPFALTSSQRQALDDIHMDLSSTNGMHRLLQGDVGSGKTVVAGAALLCAVEAGCQAAFMAPTEILAVQHARTLADYFQRAGVPVTLLIGSIAAKEKRKIHEGIAGGQLKVIIGTHALIQEGVRFKNLGVVVIDEQHRFGVRQRAALLGHGTRPHLLVMTATPIPRSLALTAYADLDLSVIDEMPPGKAAVKTRIVKPEKREDMLRFVLEELKQGARAYFLYPLIEETEKHDLEAATAAYRNLSHGIFGEVGVGLLHGKMSFDEKQKVMADFAAGRKRLLVSTTVVEVGVHVPEATIMAVHNPDRFGLSQLHQLRGRVGRGAREGYCFLLLNEGMATTARQRLRILTSVTDGFKIAEEDLRTRGPGEFFGVKQHGVPGFKLANPLADRNLVEKANSLVRHFLAKDPDLVSPETIMCRRYLAAYSSVEMELATAG